MLQIDYTKFREGVEALERCKAEYITSLDRLNEETEKLRMYVSETQIPELEEIRERIKKAQDLYGCLISLTNAAGLSLYQYQLVGKLTAYQCESIFISPIKGRKMRKIALKHLKNEMSGIKFGEESE